MESPATNTRRPGLLTALAYLTLSSGVVNVLWGAVAFSNFIGVLCAPVTVLPIILGAFEVIYAARLLSLQSRPLLPSPSIAKFEILCLLFGNVFSMVVGILALVFYNDLQVKAYFARLGGAVAPAPAAESAPGGDASDAGQGT